MRAVAKLKTIIYRNLERGFGKYIKEMEHMIKPGHGDKEHYRILLY